MVFQCPFFYSYYKQNVYKEDDPSTHINWYDLSVGFDVYLSFFTKATAILYSFGFQYGACPIYKSLKNNDKRRLNKLNMRSIILVTICLIFACVFGYLSVPVNTPELIIYREWQNVFSNDWIMIFGKFGVFVSVIFSYPTVWCSLRLSIFQLIFRSSSFSNLQ